MVSIAADIVTARNTVRQSSRGQRAHHTRMARVLTRRQDSRGRWRPLDQNGCWCNSPGDAAYQCVAIKALQPVLQTLIHALLDAREVTQQLRDLHAEGYRSLAIVFAHSYLSPVHEQQVATIARRIGFDSISVSSEIESKIGFIARGQSATADAYLTPEVQRYLKGFAKGFRGHLEDGACRVSFMQSDGALADFRKFSGLRAILCR